MLYDWIKALHVIANFAWMAGMFYLPRLYVYHAMAKKGSELSETLKVMERRLLRAILNPAMIAAWVFGVWMLYLNPALLHNRSMQIKFLCLIAMQISHALMARARKQFAADTNTHSDKYYRILNEVPTVLLIIIIIMVMIKPF
jgi:putative membrane protein